MPPKRRQIYISGNGVTSIEFTLSETEPPRNNNTVGSMPKHYAMKEYTSILDHDIGWEYWNPIDFNLEVRISGDDRKQGWVGPRDCSGAVRIVLPQHDPYLREAKSENKWTRQRWQPMRHDSRERYWELNNEKLLLGVVKSRLQWAGTVYRIKTQEPMRNISAETFRQATILKTEELGE